jgi:hypothetical protein
MRHATRWLLGFLLVFGLGCGEEDPAAPPERVSDPVSDPIASVDDPGGRPTPEPDAEPSADPATEDGSDFLRFVVTGEHEGRLETAIASFRNRDGVVVDLVAVVHIADQEFYDELDRRFEGYDAVLYEMIAPEGADPAGISKSGSPVSFIQKAMCRGLGLAFQLDAVDYGADNFVHADLTTEGFARRWEERNMNFFKLAWQIIASSAGAGEQSQLSPQAMFEAIRSKNRKQRMKFLLGQEFSKLELMFAGTRTASGTDDSILIGDRNKAALDVLEAEVARGKKKLALFYGAGHMTDFEVRLTRDLSFEPVSRSWLTAWQVGGE